VNRGVLHRSKTYSREQVPDACVSRLSLYLRELRQLEQRDIRYVSSHKLADHLGISDAQVRKDLGYFGYFGTSGRGYAVDRLKGSLRTILGTSGEGWNVALAGCGNLGSALLAYRGFQDQGFVFKVAVDSDRELVGRQVGALCIHPVEELAGLSREEQVTIGLIAVPIMSAQAVCDQLVEGGVKAVLNFAPVHLRVPESVWLRTVDLATELESLTFHLAQAGV